MFGFLEKLIPGFKRGVNAAERDGEAARTGGFWRRLSVARNPNTAQEVLYYMAQSDPSPHVRRAVAKNKATPVHASMILAGDRSVDVRMALAARLVDLLPQLSSEAHSQLYAYVVQALGTLALDEVLKVRKALSSTLKDHAHAPPKVAGQLARDVERDVAEPILRFCASLSDADLLEILKEHPAGWAIEAVAGRIKVSEKVSKAVIDTNHVPAGTILLGNEGASIPPSLLETIVMRAREYPEWHEPLALRKSLPPSMAEMLAEFVDERVRTLLQKRADFDEKTSETIAAVVRRRIDYEEKQSAGAHSPAERVNALVRKGLLNESAIADALAMRDKEFVVAALASLTRSTASDIQKIFQMRAAKPITAMAWKAGLSMRMALRLQQDMGLVAPKELLYPKGGTDYPMTREEIQWQLEFLDL